MPSAVASAVAVTPMSRLLASACAQTSSLVICRDRFLSACLTRSPLTYREALALRASSGVPRFQWDRSPRYPT